MTLINPETSLPARHEEPLISVIMPVYQGEATIEQAIRSVLSQTYTNLELWVADDGSTDNTAERVAAITDFRVHYVRQANQGTAAARTMAMAQAKGEWFAFLDADDCWLPTALADNLSVAWSNANKAPCIIYNGYHAIDVQGRLLHHSPEPMPSGWVFDELLARGCFIMIGLAMIHRQVWQACGPFRADCHHEDFEFVLRASREFQAFYTGKRNVLYRQSTQGKARGILADFDKTVIEQLKMVETVEPLLNAEQTARFRKEQMNHLICQFMMYGYPHYARRLVPQADPKTLCGSLKGKLAWYGLKTGINWLWLARELMQRYNRCISARFWRP